MEYTVWNVIESSVRQEENRSQVLWLRCLPQPLGRRGAEIANQAREGLSFGRPLQTVYLLNSAPPAHCALRLFCSELCKHGYLLLPRHSLKVFCFCLEQRLCAGTPSAVPLRLFLFPSLGQSLQSPASGCRFAGNSFSVFSLHPCKLKGSAFGAVRGGAEVSRLCRPVLILAEGLALKTRNALPVPASHRLGASTASSYSLHMKRHSLQL